MNILGVIGGVLGKAAGAISFIVQIGKQLKPFIRAAREVSPDVEAIVSKLEEKVEAGGEEADDFLDRNVEVVRDLDGFFAELEAVGRDGQAMTSYALLASQEDSPDTLRGAGQADWCPEGQPAGSGHEVGPGGEAGGAGVDRQPTKDEAPAGWWGL